MPPIGRPKIDAEKKKAGALSFRLSDSERIEIEQAASKDGQRTTTWARETVLARARKKG